MSLAGVVTSIPPNPKVVYIHLVPYNLTWELNRSRLLEYFPESILSDAIMGDPDVTEIPITNPIITPEFMSYLYLILHYGKYIDPSFDTRPAGLYLNIPIFTVLDRDYIRNFIITPWISDDYTLLTPLAISYNDLEVVSITVPKTDWADLTQAITRSVIDGQADIVAILRRNGLDFATQAVDRPSTISYLINSSGSSFAADNLPEHKTYELVYVLIRASVMVNKGNHAAIIHSLLQDKIIPVEVITDILRTQKRIPSHIALDLAHSIPPENWPREIQLDEQGIPVRETILQNLIQTRDTATLKYILDLSPNHYRIPLITLLNWAADYDWPDYFQRYTLRPQSNRVYLGIAANSNSLQVFDLLLQPLNCERRRKLFLSYHGEDDNDAAVLNLLLNDACIRPEEISELIRENLLREWTGFIDVLLDTYDRETVITMVRNIIEPMMAAGHIFGGDELNYLRYQGILVRD